MATARPILDLKTMTDRPFVRIDGVAYPLRATDDFSVLEFHTHAAEVPRFAALMNQASLSDDEGAEMSLLLQRYATRVLAAPDEVHAKLTDGQRLMVVTVFSKLLGSGGLIAGALMLHAMTAPTTMIGAPSSPGSSASTAATP